MRISDWSSDVCFSDLLASDDQRICRLGTLLPRDRAAAAHGLSVKVHAEQLSNSHGAALAARYGALSADHLAHLDAAGIAAMATAGTVAVLPPGALYFMRAPQHGKRDLYVESVPVRVDVRGRRRIRKNKSTNRTTTRIQS